MKLDKSKPLDLDAHLGKVKNKIPLVGVELEGAWIKLPAGVRQLVHDGSVFNGQMPIGANYLGELPIGPISPGGLKDVMARNYPSHVNKTCGMHIHASFDTLWHYHLLMVPEYPVTVVEYLTRWAKSKDFTPAHSIWERLEGKNRYCKHEYDADLQVKSKQKNHNMDAPGQRYTGIHYCGRLKTIECRILPMMKKFPVALEAVHEFINITNACLYVLGKAAPRAKSQVPVTLPDSTTYEETIIEVI